eukprot:CAMPEP_0119054278 /NCGR_PEP_ID=MMETSP1177-20130426/74965_1 /TAXON_ID=2985 /ORGANISM="Ochromonas sp, Strain CCMP1899" /LENGTH=511 /DNA_ID=CAMNT_0007034469 /DNA_START=1048 /DNA_END=2583 /DNA_ORIENTATION=-
MSAASHRSRGNDLFKEGTDSESPYMFWRIRKFEEAILAYQDGKKKASRERNPQEWLKCTRSIGVTAAKLAMTEILHVDKTIQWIKFNYQRALSCFSECISNSIASTDDADISWIEGIILKIDSVIESATSYITKASVLWQVRCTFLEDLQQKSNSSEGGSAICYVDMQINIQVAKEMFKSISTFDNDGAWRNCLSMTDEPNRPLSLARSLYNQSEKLFAFHHFDEVEIYETIEDMEKSQKLYRGRSMAFQERYTGEEILKSLLFEAEQLDMESVWVCIDHYTSSMNVLRIESNVVERKERVHEEDDDSLGDIDEGVNNGEDGEDAYLCYEGVACACSSLGVIFEKVLKMEDKAHDYFLRAIQYADIVTHTSGAVFFHVEWYKIAQRGVQEYRRRREGFDLSEIAKQREPFLLILKPKLEAMDAAIALFQGKSYQAYSLLTHIYEHVPPKNGELLSENLDKNDKEAMKKAIKKAICHYHTDMSSNKREGMEWLILCEEITKKLNNFYEYHKA